MLKVKISDAEFKKLDALLQKEYKKAEGDDAEGYALDHDGVTEADVEEVRRAKENEVKLHKETKGKLKAKEADYEALEKEKTKSSDDVKKAEEKLTAKHSEALAKETKRVEALRASNTKALRDKAIDELGAELFKPDSLVVGKLGLKERIRVDWDDDDAPTLVYLDANGQPATKEGVKKFFLKDPDFASIVKVSGASGAGAAPGAAPVALPGSSLTPIGGKVPGGAFQQPDPASLLAAVEAKQTGT